jgi:hypothetical protein
MPRCRTDTCKRYLRMGTASRTMPARDMPYETHDGADAARRYERERYQDENNHPGLGVGHGLGVGPGRVSGLALYPGLGRGPPLQRQVGTLSGVERDRNQSRRV